MSFLLDERNQGADAASVGDGDAVADHRGEVWRVPVLRGVGKDGEIVDRTMCLLYCNGCTLTEVRQEQATFVSAPLIRLT
eukprot:5354194-Pyramimonas_sp.AAC.1